MHKKPVLLLTLIITSTMLAGCRKSSPQPETSGKEPPTEISVGYWNVTDNLTGDPLQEYIEDKFNISLVPISMNYDNYPSVLQQLSVQNNLPDLFTNDILGTSTYETWIKTNKIRSIPKDLSDYPKLDAYLSQPYTERFKRTDGFVYAIPRMTYDSEFLWALDRCILVRKDWMKELGLDAPQNWEEFEAMLSAFVHDDPDGNGLDDTEGLNATHPNTLEAVFLSLFPELSNTERGWMYEEGQWMPVYNSVKTAAALQKVQDLYRQGLLSSQIFYTTTAAAKDDFINGKTGAICMQYYGLIKYFAEKGMLDRADDMIMVIPPWPAEDGNRYRFTTSLHWAEVYFGSNVTDEKMAKILEILEWVLSDEFNYIWQYGLEGVDWEYRDGQPYLLGSNAVSPMVKYPSLSLFCYLVKWNQDAQYEDSKGNELLYGKENIETAQNLLAWYQENTERVNYNYDIIFMSTPAKDNLVSNRYVQQQMFKVILEEEDALTAWPRALDSIRETTTLRQAIEEVTAEAQRLGIEP